MNLFASDAIPGWYGFAGDGWWVLAPNPREPIDASRKAPLDGAKVFVTPSPEGDGLSLPAKPEASHSAERITP